MNKMWIANGKSPNPSGRPKNVNSVRTIKGMVERFIKKNITPNKLQVMYNGLKEPQKIEMLMSLLPYVIARVQPDAISESELQELYEKLEKKVINDVSKEERKAG